MMDREDRKKLTKSIIIIIDILTIIALLIQIQSYIVKVWGFSKNGVFSISIESFFISYDYYGLAGAITNSLGLIQGYNYSDWSPDIYYRIAERVNGTIIESLAIKIRFILFLANFWVIYEKKRNKDDLIKYPKTMIINIVFVITKIILYWWHFYRMIGI